jgi:hypothetical protein
METQDKKFSITLDRDITESNNLNELEMLAIEYCITEEYDCFDTKAGDVIKISSIEKHDWEADNFYSLIYDNHIEIDVNIDALDVNDWKFLISELTKIKFEDSSYANDECDSIANEENDIIIFLPNYEYPTFQIKKLSSYGMYDDTTKEINNIVELVKEINNLKK